MTSTTHPAAHTLAKLAVSITVGLTLRLGAAWFTPAHAATPTTIWVDKASKGGRCSDTRTRTTATQTSPLCTLTRAANLATDGDTVMIRAATYTETLRPLDSGTPTSPIRYTAYEPGVVIDASTVATGILVIGRTDLRLSGLTVKNGGSQGIWVDSSARVSFDTVTVTGNGFGLRAKSSSNLTVQNSTLTANRGAGVMELGGVARGRYLHDDITNNGHDGQPYNGDGLQLDGTSALISDCDITGNGDNALYEHGIYASTTALGYTIENSRFSGNSATNVKAEGSGIVRSNQFGSARLGMYVDKNTAPRRDRLLQHLHWHLRLGRPDRHRRPAHPGRQHPQRTAAQAPVTQASPRLTGTRSGTGEAQQRIGRRQSCLQPAKVDPDPGQHASAAVPMAGEREVRVAGGSRRGSLHSVATRDRSSVARSGTAAGSGAPPACHGRHPCGGALGDLQSQRTGRRAIVDEQREQWRPGRRRRAGEPTG